MNGWAKTSSQWTTSPGRGVGRAKRSIESTRKPRRSRRARYSSAVGKYHGSTAALSTPRARRASANESRTEATHPAPPHSATNRPPGFSALHTPSMAASASGIQCRAALLKTASNSASKGSSRASTMRASSPRCRAAHTCSGLLSTPTTVQPASRNRSVRAPSPQPTSSTRSPGRGASRSTTGAPRSETKRACSAYDSGSQCWVMSAARRARRGSGRRCRWPCPRPRRCLRRRGRRSLRGW